ncbi:MAG: hypothetical protein VYC34_10395 [Planctomycetota bacterium]|nr:hypothetical protein [Planctomycetota bacterium]
MNRTVIVCALAAGASATGASPQFFTSITKPLFGNNDPDIFFADVQTGASTFLLNPEAEPAISASAPGFTGLAADEPGSRLFAITTNGTRSGLYSLDYATLTPTFLSNITRPASTDGLVLDGLAYDSSRSVLYATRRLGGTTGTEGLYSINPATGESTVLLEYESGTFNIEISAIDYDPVTDMVYLVDEDADAGRGIYSFNPVDPGAGLSLLASLPSDITDVDGLGAGDGQLFLLSDGPDANGGFHRVFDLTTMTFDIASIPTPYPEYSDSVLGPINPSGGGAYAPGIPGPATALLALPATALLARRRRN